MIGINLGVNLGLRELLVVGFLKRVPRRSLLILRAQRATSADVTLRNNGGREAKVNVNVMD